MVKRIISMIKKEIIQVFRNHITLALILVSPIVQLIIFGYVAIIDVENIPTAVLDYSSTTESRRLLSDFSNSGYFDLKLFLENPDRIEGLINNGAVDLIIIIPENFARRIHRSEQTELLGIIDGTDSNTAITVGNYFNGVALRYSANIARKLASAVVHSDISMPVDARQRVLFNPEMKSLYYLVPGIIAILLMLLMVILSSISIVRERERGTFEQLTVTPIRVGELLIGKTVPFALLGYVTAFLITVVGLVWFRVPFHGDLFLLICTTGIYMVTALGLGILVSSIARTQQQALMLSMFVLVPQILLSGFIFPIESMPDIMQTITIIIPARYFLSIIRGIYLKGVGFDILLPEITSLLVFSIIVFSIAAVRFSRKVQI